MDSQKEKIEELESLWLKGPAQEFKYTHTFAPGVYIRESFFPADSYAIGHEHSTDHINILLEGSCSILAGEETIVLKAPLVFVAKKGVRKIAYFPENSRWANVLPNPADETNLETLENIFVIKSRAFIEHQISQQKLAELTQ